MTRKEAKKNGLKQYYTGIHCLRGHLAMRCTYDGCCTKCKKLMKKRVRELDPERARFLDRAQAKRYSSKNRPLIRLIAHKSYHKNRDKILERARVYAINNKEKISVYVKNNLPYFNRKSAERRAKKIKATPVWADNSAIADIFIEANYHQMHVDHIVPLVSERVCGLHWEGNLQLLTATDNRRKKNTIWPDM